MNSFQRMVRRYTGADVELSAEELKLIEKRCNEIVVAQQFRFWAIVLLTAISTALVSSVGAKALGPLLAAASGWPHTWCVAGVGLGIACVTIAMWLLVYERVYVRPLRHAMTEMGYEVCQRCGYWLRGLDESVTKCPECGAMRESAARHNHGEHRGHGEGIRD